jgi:hypothetical protein
MALCVRTALLGSPYHRRPLTVTVGGLADGTSIGPVDGIVAVRCPGWRSLGCTTRVLCHRMSELITVVVSAVLIAGALPMIGVFVIRSSAP